MVVADINGDGLPDPVTSDSFANAVNVDINQGGGNFSSMQIVVPGADFVGWAVVAGFDQDGGVDIAMPNSFTGVISTYLNRGTNTVQLSNVALPRTGTHVLEATTAAGGVYIAGVSNT
jgi:hypothetical protein